MKKVIVMGASSGMGLQIASDFARLGMRVGMAARREEPMKALKGPREDPKTPVVKRHRNSSLNQ